MLTRFEIESAVRAALVEDAPWGDLTSTALFGPTARAEALLVSREHGTFSGGEVFRAAFELLDRDVRVTDLVPDGTRFAPGDELARVAGSARSVLQSERVALNFVQRMSGTATLTSRFVDAVRGTSTRIADTRKTTPGLRAFEKHAVVSGGGHNHRYSLSDAVMVKDNHLAVVTNGGESVSGALRALRARLPHTTHVEVEVDRLDQIEEVLAGGADTVMLDNFTLDDLRRGVSLIDGRAVAEASGTVSLETVRAIAETGVDVVSVGALTHSARALDLGLDVRISPHDALGEAVETWTP
ncbi:nicotinate-nucleotide pyrophosphorylase [carboxylating] [Labedella gwakjiensis]|uniref:Nicotinate-nucleotide pyrophosphorylase [carboxylating] n=1 Tax=Labedella gwakjiensis TaxID=390269 RepID=A0A2P8H144_9MICO|nr:carboxylating nicotinate-nucleotide diphosphorylase [Labedella gwakjiensis]PSL39939.1 nicotinate-nucleotide pyrophosphorylase [carboxylating] [Labedella gwakjiensis]RUQ85700.1 carboxylating nicotinate-nucleotide diphosphorylase [Labedella gwakjiensis]